MIPRARRQALAALAALAAVVVVQPGALAQDTTDYAVKEYVLAVELTRGSGTAHVTMDLTYEIGSGKKSEGFKYIANFEPYDLRGVESDGTPMQMSVEHQRETLIRWKFRPAGPGEKHVSVMFSIPGAVMGNTAENTFSASWAGIFKVPVRHAIYRLVAPADWNERSVNVWPSRFTLTKVGGRLAYEVEQRPLSEPVFTVTMRPGFVDSAPLRAAGGADAAVPVRQSSRGAKGFQTLLLVGVLLVVLIAIVAASAKRNRRGGGARRSGDDSGHYFAGGCAGGSSCSSSCGGSGCGGGCGG